MQFNIQNNKGGGGFGRFQGTQHKHKMQMKT